MFETWNLRHLNLFRNSNLVLRISTYQAYKIFKFFIYLHRPTEPLRSRAARLRQGYGGRCPMVELATRLTLDQKILGSNPSRATQTTP